MQEIREGKGGGGEGEGEREGSGREVGGHVRTYRITSGSHVVYRHMVVTSEVCVMQQVRSLYLFECVCDLVVQEGHHVLGGLFMS